MEITRRKILNAKKNLEVAISRMEQLYPTELDIIDELRESRIKLGGIIHQLDVYSTIEEKAN